MYGQQYQEYAYWCVSVKSLHVRKNKQKIYFFKITLYITLQQLVLDVKPLLALF